MISVCSHQNQQAAWSASERGGMPARTSGPWAAAAPSPECESRPQGRGSQRAHGNPPHLLLRAFHQAGSAPLSVRPLSPYTLDTAEQG